ncbi:putative WD40/YVTN repeat-like-containing domain superfamily [Helianthus debilis subsp. tardiflorus]
MVTGQLSDARSRFLGLRAPKLFSILCAEGVVAVAGDALRVFTIERLGETFNETAIPLRYTPRKFVFHPKKKLLVTIESDQGAFPAELRESAKKECFEAAGQGENGKMEIENGVMMKTKMTRYLMNNTGIRKLNRISGFLVFGFLTLRQPRQHGLLELQDTRLRVQYMHCEFPR